MFFKMFIDDQQGQIIITVVVEGATGQYLRSKCQLAIYSRAFRGRDNRCGNRLEFPCRTVETGAAARPGGLGTARRHQAR